MSQLSSAPATRPLRGTVTVPGDKSITHRAFILGALAQGLTRITGYSRGEDCLNTLGAIRELGIDVREIPEGLEVNGQGLWGLTEPSNVLDCGNSGTGLRLLADSILPDRTLAHQHLPPLGERRMFFAPRTTSSGVSPKRLRR